MPPPANTPEFGVVDIAALDEMPPDVTESSIPAATRRPRRRLSEVSGPATPLRSTSPSSRQPSPSTVDSDPSTRSSTPVPQHDAPSDRGNPPSRPSRSGLHSPPIDYQDLEYVDDVDETLICPICRTPFHEPITTKRCGHTFCTGCLRRAVELQPVCPIDRQPIAFHPDQLCNPRIVSHQLDRLKVRCPNAGCAHVTTRGLIGTHYDRHCARTLVPCPDVGCDKLVPREDAASEQCCLHREVRCRYCDVPVLLADEERHYDTECRGHQAKCLLCNAVVIRHRMADHVANHCPESQTVCKFHPFGCTVAGTRRSVEAHEAAGCVYEAIGKLTRDRAEDRAVISDLRGRLTFLEQRARSTTATTAHHSSRSPRSRTGGNIPDLDLSVARGQTSQSSSYLQDSGGGGGNGTAWESPEDYMLAQFERMEAKIEDLRKMLTELDGRHSMMLLNETMPLKDQITELRSNLGVINMHTTWLMNVQRQNRVAAGGGGSGGQGQGQGQQGQRSGNGGSGGGGGGMAAGSGTGRSGDADEGREFERQRVHVAPRRMSGENPPRL
ncbi:TNF receptor-associated factor 6 [Coniochaeta hoffmannii]|uniref:TNF receptor-associated factor 6 n=1 Tax=Coniochaeta hoffmannii TaxID=91930 RepID=A0AA38VKV7_9PEZI|nr:TNF receptor-associated factor 6 [Coniochaeta hoffmannii]